MEKDVKGRAEFMKCMKCGKNLEDNECRCLNCEYKNNLESGFIDEDIIISKPGEKRVLDYKSIIKKTTMVIIATVMVGVASAGGIYILSADNEIKISLGLMSSSESTYKKQAKELLRGAKLGMSREEIMTLESQYNDSTKEINNEEYIAYTGCRYGGYEGRTTYRFTNNQLSKIEVIFYPKENKDEVYGDLVNVFTKEYGESLGNNTSGEGEDAIDENVKSWKYRNKLIELKNEEYIKLTVDKGTK